jgi:hypothetical protein
MFICVLCVFALPNGDGAHPCAQTSVVSADQTQIRLSLTAAKNKFELGEAIILKLEITNVGKVPVLIGKRPGINTQHDIPTGPHLEIELRDEKGRRSPSLTLTADSFGIPSKKPAIQSLLGNWLVLNPKSSYATKLALDRGYFEFLSRPGRYRISGTYLAPDIFASSTSHQLGLTEDDLKAIPAKCWNGNLKFQPITFEITPADSK